MPTCCVEVPLTLPRISPVKRFAADVVAPRVREMDENESMDPAVIQGLFDQGVSLPELRLPVYAL